MAVVTVHLRYRPPYDWEAMIAHLGARAIAGVESVEGGVYRRTLQHEGASGVICIAHSPATSSLMVTLQMPDVEGLGAIEARVRRVFDLDADIGAIGAHLSRDPWLSPLVAARPGLRAPGGWDGFELAVRAVLGQQVTLQAARQLAGHVVRVCGAPVADSAGDLRLAFPTAAAVSRADLSVLGMPRARQQTLAAMANAALADPQLFTALGSLEETVARLRAIRGVGDWTAQYIALRAAREPDAFPSSDIGLLRSAARGGTRPSPAELLAMAQPWRPWRAYAAQHLWASEAASRDARGERTS